MHWLSTNYKWLFDGVAGLTVITIGGLVVRRVFRSKESPPAPSINNNTQTVLPSMNNSATQTVNINLAAQPSSETQPQGHVAESATLLPLVAQEVLVAQDDISGAWHEGPLHPQRDRRAIVLPFKNVPKQAGHRTPRAEDVSSSLVFRNAEGSVQMDISRGVWTCLTGCSVTFEPGETHSLLVALREDHFVTFECPNTSGNPVYGVYSKIKRPLRRALWEKGTVEITLIDGQGITVFHGVFNYKLSGEKMTLTPK